MFLEKTKGTTWVNSCTQDDMGPTNLTRYFSKTLGGTTSDFQPNPIL